MMHLNSEFKWSVLKKRKMNKEGMCMCRFVFPELGLKAYCLTEIPQFRVAAIGFLVFSEL